MKALILPVLTLAALLALSLWTGSYVSCQTAAWSEDLAAADRLAQAEQWTQAEALLRAGYRRWESRQELFHMLMEHQELDQAEALFAQAGAALSQRDLPDFHAALAQLRLQLRLLAETQQLSLRNIL